MQYWAPPFKHTHKQLYTYTLSLYLYADGGGFDSADSRRWATTMLAIVLLLLCGCVRCAMLTYWCISNNCVRKVFGVRATAMAEGGWHGAFARTFFFCWVYASTSVRLHVCGRCSYIFVGIGEELHAIAHEPLLYIANIKIDTPYTFRRDATLCGVFAVYMYILCGHLDFSSIVPSAKTSWVVTARITRKDIHYS